MTSETILRATNLTKGYKVPGGRVHAVRGISLDLEKGKTLAIVGESGCGKSTLGRVLVGLESPDSGTIEASSLIPMVFQDSLGSLHPRRTVLALICEPLVIRDGLLRASAQHELRAKDLARQVGLADESLASLPHELSGGQRQRVNIARALALNPEVILLDEPVSALDVSIQAQILNLLLELQESRGLSIVFISHDLSVVRHIAHDVLVLYLGSVLERGPADEVLSRPSHPYTQALLASDPSRHQGPGQVSLKDEPPSPLEVLPGCAFASRCPFVEASCRVEKPVLKNVGAKSVACFPVQRGLQVGYEPTPNLS